MAKKQSKMGRPKKPANEVRSVNLQLRLTREERKALEKAASGGNVSEWCRVVLMRAAGHK